MPSRKIEDLLPDVAKMCREHIELCAKNGIKLIVYQTKRSMYEQAIYFAQGRKLATLPKSVVTLIQEDICMWLAKGLSVGPGPRVTNALPDENAPHIMGIAFDVAPSRFGKLAWSDKDLPEENRGQTDWDELWNKIGAYGESVGLLWGNAWGDKPHFQRKEN